jgi:hypothetical protein
VGVQWPICLEGPPCSESQAAATQGDETEVAGTAAADLDGQDSDLGRMEWTNPGSADTARGCRRVHTASSESYRLVNLWTRSKKLNSWQHTDSSGKHPLSLSSGFLSLGVGISTTNVPRIGGNDPGDAESSLQKERGVPYSGTIYISGTGVFLV